MGMTGFNYFLSWLIYYIIIYTIISILNCLILKYTFPNFNLGLGIPIIILFGLALTFQAFCIQSLFSSL
jgi:hypothetical protein